jgi:hypothetical protein
MNFNRSNSSYHTELSTIIKEKCKNWRKKRYLSILWSWFLQASRGTAPILYWVKSIKIMSLVTHVHLLKISKNSMFHVVNFWNVWIIGYINIFAQQQQHSNHSSNFFFDTHKLKLNVLCVSLILRNHNFKSFKIFMH